MSNIYSSDTGSFNPSETKVSSSLNIPARSVATAVGQVYFGAAPTGSLPLTFNLTSGSAPLTEFSFVQYLGNQLCISTLLIVNNSDTPLVGTVTYENDTDQNNVQHYLQVDLSDALTGFGSGLISDRVKIKRHDLILSRSEIKKLLAFNSNKSEDNFQPLILNLSGSLTGTIFSKSTKLFFGSPSLIFEIPTTQTAQFSVTLSIINDVGDEKIQSRKTMILTNDSTIDKFYELSFNDIIFNKITLDNAGNLSYIFNFVGYNSDL